MQKLNQGTYPIIRLADYFDLKKKKLKMDRHQKSYKGELKNA